MYFINAILILLISINFVKSLNYPYNYIVPNPSILNYNNKFAKYIVSIQNKEPNGSYFGENHYCGGVIIAPRYVLTSSHCVFDTRFHRYLREPNEILLIAGTPNRLWPTSHTKILNVAEIIPYSYARVFMRHDLAVLRLNETIDFNQTQSLGIATLDDILPSPTQCVVYGWGTYFLNGPFAENLLELEFRIQSVRRCYQIYPRIFIRSMICAFPSPQSPKDACNGDSGGALFCGNKLTGVVSQGVFCNRKYPTIFAGIFYHRDWIQSAIGGAGFCHHWQHIMFNLLSFMIALQKI